MEEHDDDLMLGEDDHNLHHDEDENNHAIHHEDEEHMDIEPNRIEGVSTSSPAPLDRDEFWDREPTKEEIWEMKKANKRPSEWLKLLCKDWAEAEENLELVETVDSKFVSYKPYLKGKLTSQLLCRLCIPSESGSAKETTDNNNNNNNNNTSNSNDSGSASNTSNRNNRTKPDFLGTVLNIQDEFDKAYVISQVERFCALYDVRGIQQAAAAAASTAANSPTGGSSTTATTSEATAAAAAALYGDLVVNAALGNVSDVHQQAIAAAAAATATAAGQQGIPPHFLTADATAAAVAAAQQAQAQAAQQQSSNTTEVQSNKGSSIKNETTSNAASQHVFATSRSAQALLTKAQQQAKLAEKALEQERKQNARREQKRISDDKKLAKQRDRESLQKQKMAEKMAREKAREEKRNRKLLQRQERERFAQEQKEAALRRAAELVASNRVPIEITRAGAFRNRSKAKLPIMNPTKAGATSRGAKATDMASSIPKKRQRSAIVVSTASDLDRIVTHSQNLWAKYNAIAKEHNQRVNWITVAKELGIHVKVREKYARMHSRACQRNFDFVANGHWKIKDHPEIFQEPTAAEQKARMPPPLPPPVETTAAAAAPVGLGEPPSIKGEGEEQQQQAQLPEQDAIKKPETAQAGVSASSIAVAPTGVVTGPPASPGGHQHLGIHNSVDAAAAAATAAAVVDAAGVGGATIDMHHVVELTAATTAATVEGGASNGAAHATEIPTNTNDGGVGNASASETVAFEL